jgi:hypothetical protein
LRIVLNLRTIEACRPKLIKTPFFTEGYSRPSGIAAGDFWLFIRYFPLPSVTFRYFRYFPVQKNRKSNEKEIGSGTFRYFPLFPLLFRRSKKSTEVPESNGSIFPLLSDIFPLLSDIFPLLSVTFPLLSVTFRYFPLLSVTCGQKWP